MILLLSPRTTTGGYLRVWLQPRKATICCIRTRRERILEKTTISPHVTTEEGEEDDADEENDEEADEEGEEEDEEELDPV